MVVGVFQSNHTRHGGLPRFSRQPYFVEAVMWSHLNLNYWKLQALTFLIKPVKRYFWSLRLSFPATILGISQISWHLLRQAGRGNNSISVFNLVRSKCVTICLYLMRYIQKWVETSDITQSGSEPVRHDTSYWNVGRFCHSRQYFTRLTLTFRAIWSLKMAPVSWFTTRPHRYRTQKLYHW